MSRSRDAAQASATTLAGLCAVAAAALSVALYVWLSLAAFVPIASRDPVEYVFISSTARSLLLIATVAGVILIAAHLAVRWMARREQPQPPLWSWRDVAYLQPLWWFAARGLALLNLIRPHGRFLSVLSYVVADLRWWWTALVVLWAVRSVDQRTAGVWRRRLASVNVSSAVRRWLPEATIVAITVPWVVFGTPILRLYGATNGDEPKYVRYCENLYQGLGFEISQIKPMAALPADFHPPLWRNLALLAEVLPQDLRSLSSDTIAYLRHPSRQFNRAHHREGGFLDGKDGGMYQVHGPGLSLLMFPAYYVDRANAEIQPGSPAQWPTRLPTVNAFFVAVYAFWTVLIFRLLRQSGASTAIAWTVSLVSTMTMPASAFPFQYYPELAAGLVITAVATHLLFGDPDRLGRSFFFGLLTGYLPWFHVRFSIVMAALAVGACVLWRGQWRRLFAFLAAVAVPLALFSLYAYRITGSVMPSALWVAEGSEPNFNFVGMVKNSVGYLLDREWGLFAHSPVFLLALPGWWWLWQRRPRVAFLGALVFLALLLPAAGKTLVQTTPMRLIVAVVPLGALGMIEVLARRSRVVLVVFALLLIVSLDNALGYNLYHYRHMDTLATSSFSGWRVNLLFPRESRRPLLISPANAALLAAWIVVVLGLFCTPTLIRWARVRRWAPLRAIGASWSTVRLAFVATALFVLIGTSVAAATSGWVQIRYLMPPAEAAAQAALALDALHDCTLCLSSTSGSLNRRRMTADLEAVDPAVAERRVSVSTPTYEEWLAMPGQIRAWYTAATGRPPSDTDIGHLMYQWREDHVAPAEIRRRIFASAEKAP